MTLAGNFDPTAALLFSTPDKVRAAAQQCILDGTVPGPGGGRFLLQPGCEVPPQTPEANIAAFCPC